MLKHYILSFLCALIFPFFVSAQYPTAPNEKDSQGVRIGRWTILFDKDFKPTELKDSAQYFRVITYNKGIPSGRVYDYYLSGALQAESNLLSDQPVDVYDGTVLIYYEKGNLKYKFQFKKGELVGQHKEYYPNGVLAFTGQYINGKAEGLWEYFYESGEKKATFNYINGKTNGLKLMYSTEGKIIEKGPLLDDKRIGYWEDWYDNGSREAEGNFVDDKREGKWNFYHENNALQSSGNYRKGNKNGVWNYFYDNGQQKSFGLNKDDLLEGAWTNYLANGKLNEVTTYHNDTLNGLSTRYFESGTVKDVGEYKNDNKNGLWKYYHENGLLRMTLPYTDGKGQGYRESYSERGIVLEKIFFQNDSLAGPFYQYYEDGIIRHKGSMVADKKDGWCTQYYPDGKLKEKAQIHLDSLDGAFETYYQNGVLSSKGQYRNGLKVGYWEYFHENEKIKTKGNFVNGKKEGFWEWYFDNGQLDGKGAMKNDAQEGYWEEFYPNGKRKMKGLYAKKDKQGFWTFYHENGKVDYEGNYKDGWKEGTWKYYFSDGILNCKGAMDKGMQGPWIYYDSLGNKTSVTEFYNGYKNGKKTTFKNNHIDTVYVYSYDNLVSIASMIDSAQGEMDKHHFKEAEKLIGEIKKQEHAYYPINSVNYHLYLRSYADLYSAKGEYETAERYALQFMTTLKKYQLDTTFSYEVALNNEANNYLNLGKYDQALKLYRQSLAATVKRKGLNHYGNYVTTSNIALTYTKKNKLDSTLFTIEEYIREVKTNYGEVDSSYYQAIRLLSQFYYDQAAYVRANNVNFYLVTLLENQKNTAKSIYRQTLSNIANNYEDLHDYDSLVYFVRKAEKLYQSSKDTLSSHYFHNLKKLANYYSKTGKTDSAMTVFSFIVNKMSANPYIDQNIYRNSLFAIAAYYYDKDQYKEALERYLSLKSMLEEEGAQRDVLYGNVLETLAYIYTSYYTDKNQEAIALFERSVKNKQEAYGAESNTYFYAASNLARFYAIVNEYEKAVQEGKALLVQIEKKVGKNNLLYASHSEALGNIYYDYSDYDQALLYYQIGNAFYEANKQNEFIDYINSSVDIARCYEQLYKEDEAEKIYLSTMQQVEKKLSKENISYLKLTKYLVSLYVSNNRERSAKLYLKEVLPIAKKIVGENGSYYFGYLTSLAKIELSVGELTTCDSILSLLKEISLKYYGASSEDYLTYLKEKAALENVRENYKEADIYYLQALKLSAQLYGKNSESYARALKKTALFYRKLKRYNESEVLLLEAKSNIERIYGNKLIVYAYYAEELAKTCELKNEFSKSEKYFEEAIDIFKKENTVNSWNYLNTVNSKAKMYVSAGLYNKAKETFEHYMGVVRGYVGKDGNYALALSEIASIYRRSSSFGKAIDYQKESQRLLDSLYSIEDGRYINGLNILGLIYLDANQLDSATTYFEEYRRIMTKLYPSDSVGYSIYCNNYALVCVKKGNYAEAEKLLNTTLKIEKESITKDQTRYINFYDNYAQLYTSWGKMDKAEKYWGDVLPAILTYTNKMFGEFSEQEKTQFWSEYSKDFEIYNSYCLLHRKTKPSVLQDMYDNRIATKAIVLNSINKLRKRIYNNRDTSLVTKYETWQLLKDQTARYYGVPSKQLKDAGIALDSMERLLERLEKELNISVEDKKQVKTPAISWSTIQKKLLPGEAAIEIVRFKNYTNYLTDSIVYAALILTATTKDNPALVILPYGNKLESRYLTYYRNAIKFKDKDSLSYKVFWQPLEEKLEGINTVYISLDGVYNQLNINTLMLPDGSYLLDKRKIIIVSNTKDVVALKSSSQVSKSNVTQGVHLFGYPDYELGMDKLPVKTGTEREVTLSLDFASKNTITKLPGTKVEMDKIVVLLADKQWRFRSYQNEQATEDLVKELQSPLVLHIATHGFFLGEEQVKLGGEGYMNGQKYNPLLMSGLMLSGATKSLLGYTSHIGENGILTALEASTLNLDNTELVILSACETGKGEIKVGEGVYGLQRAFQVAGSKATIMSLWKVDDNATQQLMESFYRYWMASGNKTEAFRKAQLEVRAQYPSPYYWGAFVMMGQ